MDAHPLRLLPTVGRVLVAAAMILAAVPARPDDASAKRGNAPEVWIEKGALRNGPRGFRFPIPAGWSLTEGATANEMNFGADRCAECALRVIVSPGNSLPLQDTVRAIQDQIRQSPGVRIVGEEPVKVAKEEAYTIVKEETLPAEPPAASADGAPPAAGAAAKGPLVRTRYVTFLHKGDKFYLVLRSPKERFGVDDAAFEKLLEKFRFD